MATWNWKLLIAMAIIGVVVAMFVGARYIQNSLNLSNPNPSFTINIKVVECEVHSACNIDSHKNNEVVLEYYLGSTLIVSLYGIGADVVFSGNNVAGTVYVLSEQDNSVAIGVTGVTSSQ